MTAHDFTIWLSGFDEINATPPTAAQWEIIRDHLYLAMGKADPKPKTTYPATPPVQPYVPPLGSAAWVSCAVRSDLSITGNKAETPTLSIESDNSLLVNIGHILSITC